LLYGIVIDTVLQATGGGDSFVKLWDMNHLVDGKSSGVELAFDMPLTDVPVRIIIRVNIAINSWF
jgi:hypothetical protein